MRDLKPNNELASFGSLSTNSMRSRNFAFEPVLFSISTESLAHRRLISNGSLFIKLVNESKEFRLLNRDNYFHQLKVFFLFASPDLMTVNFFRCSFASW